MDSNRISLEVKQTNLGDGFPVKDKGMEQLCAGHRHQEPAAKPPGLLFQPALLIENIVQKLQAPGGRVDRNRDPQPTLRADAQRKPGHAGADGRRISRGQRPGNARVALAERPRIVRAKVRSQSNEEAMQDAVDKQDERQRQR